MKVGDKIRIGKEYSKFSKGRFKEGQIIELIEGKFDEYNGLYTHRCIHPILVWKSYTSYAPAIWNDKEKEFDSIYHLFGSNIENFLDNRVIIGGRMICNNCNEWSETYVNAGTVQDYCPVCGADLNDVGFICDDENNDNFKEEMNNEI